MMTDKAFHNFGTWPSEISADMVNSGIRLNDVQWSRNGDYLTWSQSYGGQTTLFAKAHHHDPITLTSADNKPAGGVGYGGGEFFAADDRVVFADRNGRLYQTDYATGIPQPRTPGFGACATPRLSHDKSVIVYAHSYESQDLLAAVRANGESWPVILEHGADFYLNPVLSPNDKWLAWIEWDHPNMPWDGTSLKLAKFDLASLSVSDVQVLDGFGRYACYQATFSPCGNYLAWLANNGEFDDLIIYDFKLGKKHTIISQKSLIQPAWVAGQHTLAWAPDSLSLYFIENEFGMLRLKKINLLNRNHPEQAISTIDTKGFTWLDQLTVSQKNEIAFIAQSYDQPSQIVVLRNDGMETVVQSQAEIVAKEWFSSPKTFDWTSSDGVRLHGLYYPPQNPNFKAEGLPPVIVNVHGGPTSQEFAEFDMGTTFFTSRGYAYFAVNYRGSTGYGKSYRDALRGNWGLLDVQDTIDGTQALVDAGLADPHRLIIMGGSAGGFTVFNALIHHPGFFKVGISRYGVSNLFTLEEDTHKFESHYNTSLLGDLPEQQETWEKRSPIFHVDQIRDALLIFQGTEDRVVLKNQSDSLVERLQANHIPHLYRVYEGEGHGFRQPENLVDYYETIDKFLREYL